MANDRTRIWASVIPAATLPLIASVFYFVLFAENPFARYVYAITKLFTIVWPLITIHFILRTGWPRIAWDTKHELKAVPMGAAFGVAVVALMFVALQTSIGDMVDRNAGRIGGIVKNFGIHETYWLFAAFISFIHSFIEEYYWRWFLYGRLAKVVPNAFAHMLAGAAFAAHHVVVASVYFGLGWGFALGACVAIGGIVWSLLYEKQGTLTGAWVSHMIVDAGLMAIGHRLIFGSYL